jgi:hypothetical protein
LSPPLPPLPPDPDECSQGQVVKADPSMEEIACGSVMIAKAPAATTKMAVPAAAVGRIQPFRRAFSPGAALAGRKRSMTDQNASIAVQISGADHVAMALAASWHHATTDAKDGPGAVFIRALIRSSPSGDGSIDSAAACRARRSTSS